jgi:membrane associated rhomboid family serine protease
LIIPWQVDVPQDRWPFVNWLIIIGIIAASVFQFRSIQEQRAKYREQRAKYREARNLDRSLEDIRKEFLTEEELKEVEKLVDRHIKKCKEKGHEVPEVLRNFIRADFIEHYIFWAKVRPFVLDGWRIEGLLGHMWLHGGIIHLIGNLLFLWIFGNAVCAKIGNFFYLLIYIVVGLLAGIAHLVFQGGPAIGASGAIMGVVGIYLMFFPKNDITCYFVFFAGFSPFIREFTVSSFWMILFWLAFDVYGAIAGSGLVAYFAHLGGSVGGFALAFLMLKTKWIVMEDYEESLLQAWGKRNDPAPELYAPNRGMFPYN